MTTRIDDDSDRRILILIICFDGRLRNSVAIDATESMAPWQLRPVHAIAACARYCGLCGLCTLLRPCRLLQLVHAKGDALWQASGIAGPMCRPVLQALARCSTGVRKLVAHCEGRLRPWRADAQALGPIHAGPVYRPIHRPGRCSWSGADALHPDAAERKAGRVRVGTGESEGERP
jgi:hypothetical protein